MDGENHSIPSKWNVRFSCQGKPNAAFGLCAIEPFTITLLRNFL